MWFVFVRVVRSDVNVQHYQGVQQSVHIIFLCGDLVLRLNNWRSSGSVNHCRGEMPKHFFLFPFNSGRY